MEKRLKYLKENGYTVTEMGNNLFTAHNKILTIENTEKAFIITKEPDLSWRSAIIKETLEKLNISYLGGVFAILIETRKNNNPLFVLGMEDDDRIYFGKYDKYQWETSFDMAWSHDLNIVISNAETMIRFPE